jgi:hypothetical protein
LVVEGLIHSGAGDHRGPGFFLRGPAPIAATARASRSAAANSALFYNVEKPQTPKTN